MLKYYIDNNHGYRKDVTEFQPFAEYLPSDATLREHLEAQVNHINTVDSKHKLQSIMIGVTSEKLTELIDKLCRMYPGFSKNYFTNRKSIQFTIQPNSMPVLWIVDSEHLIKIGQE